MDDIFHSGWSMSGGASAQMTAAGISEVSTGNSSGRLVAPSGATRGIPLDGRYSNEAIVHGRLTLGAIQIGLILLVVAYIWTRNVQGGG